MTSFGGSPVVRERHMNALYICVPVPPESVQHLVAHPAQLDLHGGSAWVCVVVDHLAEMHVHIGGGMFVNSRMTGWMTKLNLLVTADLPHVGEQQRGYQIVTLDFERCVSGSAKAFGARRTQFVPAATAQYDCSLPKSYRVDGSLYTVEDRAAAPAQVADPPSSSFERSIPGMHAAAAAAAASKTRELLLLCAGEPMPLGHGASSSLSEAEEAALVRFVVDRPVKFLHHPSGALYASAWGNGHRCSADGCIALKVERLEAPILRRVGLGSADLSRATVFVQPEYSIVDHEHLRVPVSV